MWWKIEYEVWQPFQGDGDWEHHEEDSKEWKKTWKRFCELVEDDDVGCVAVTAMWGNTEYDPEDPYVLIYSAQ